MDKISEIIIVERYKWAKPQPLFEKTDSKKEIDASMQWNLNQKQLHLVKSLFAELEEWFVSRNIPIDVTIYHVGELFDRLHIDFSSNTREVFLIIDKYKQFSEALLDEEYEEDEEEDYEDVF
jgi:hypothetical protein